MESAYPGFGELIVSLIVYIDVTLFGKDKLNVSMSFYLKKILWLCIIIWKCHGNNPI